MINRHCEVCDQYIDGDVWVIRISDEKEFIEFSLHKSCSDQFYEKLIKIKDIHKLPVKKVLNILNLRR